LAHAAGVAAELLLARVPEVGLVEERVDSLFARLLVGDAFEDGEVVEELCAVTFGYTPNSWGR